MRFGQVEELLDAPPEPDAEPLAPAEGDQRVRELVARAVGIRPWVHEPDHALQAVGGGQYQQHESRQQQREQSGKQLPVHAPEKEDPHGDNGDDHECPEIRLAQQQPPDHQHHHQHGQESLAEARHVRGLARGVVGGVEHCKKLHQLRRLHGHEVQRDPALAAVHLASDPGNQHEREQGRPQHKQVRRRLLPEPQRDLERRHRRGEPDRNRQRVPHEVIRRLVPGHAAALGDRDRGRIDHHQPQAQQQDRGPYQAFVVLRDLRARLDVSVEHAL